MPNKLLYDVEELNLIYAEALASANGDFEEGEESFIYGDGAGLFNADGVEEILFDDYTIEFSAEEQLIVITFVGLVSEEFDDEDVSVFTEIVFDDDGDPLYTPFQFVE